MLLRCSIRGGDFTLTSPSCWWEFVTNHANRREVKLYIIFYPAHIHVSIRVSMSQVQPKSTLKSTYMYHGCRGHWPGIIVSFAYGHLPTMVEARTLYTFLDILVQTYLDIFCPDPRLLWICPDILRLWRCMLKWCLHVVVRQRLHGSVATYIFMTFEGTYDVILTCLVTRVCDWQRQTMRVKSRRCWRWLVERGELSMHIWS